MPVPLGHPTGRSWTLDANGRVHQPPLPTGTSTSTWAIWAISVLPIAVLATTPIQIAAEHARIAALRGGNLTGQFGPVWMLYQAITVALTAVQVVLAVIDWRTLRRRGIARPFAWGWAFLQPTYVIGRAVVAHRRTGAGLAPLWTWIALFVAATALNVTLTLTGAG